MQKIFPRSLNPKVSIDFNLIKDKDGVVLNPESISRTVQSHARESDINFIVSRAAKTGFLVDPVIQAAATRGPLFGDFTDPIDYLECKSRTATFDEIFSRLPAEIRARFDNEASKIIDFLADSANDAEAIKLGLKPKVAPAPTPAPAPVPDPVPVPEV